MYVLQDCFQGFSFAAYQVEWKNWNEIVLDDLSKEIICNLRWGWFMDLMDVHNVVNKFVKDSTENDENLMLKIWAPKECLDARVDPESIVWVVF